MNKLRIASLSIAALMTISVAACTTNSAKKGAMSTKDGVKTQTVQPYNTRTWDGVDGTTFPRKPGTYGTMNVNPNAAPNNNVYPYRAPGNVHPYANTQANSKLHSSQRTADEIVRMGSVKTANVLLTDSKAYVAVTLADHHMGTKNMVNTKAVNDITAATKKHIADKVRSINPHIQSVYVTANPDTVSRLNGFATKLSQGYPVHALMSEFNAAVKRLNPSEH